MYAQEIDCPLKRAVFQLKKLKEIGFEYSIQQTQRGGILMKASVCVPISANNIPDLIAEYGEDPDLKDFFDAYKSSVKKP